jgi:division protein CdvB (Snf7/Vps24/ESCRT-III family)
MTIMSLFKKLEDRVHTIPLKERIEQALFRLNTQKAKLEQTSMRLQQRDKEMFQRTVGAELSKDSSHARLYANECAEIRKMAHIVLSSELALERVILRLQTIEEFGDIMTQIAPVIGIVRETRGRIAGVIPEVANELGEVNDMLSDMSLESGGVEGDQSLEIQSSGREAQKVLEESGLIAEQQMKERFPELPVPGVRESQQQQPKPVAETRVPVAVAVAEVVAEPEPATSSTPQLPFEDRLLEYIKSRKGEISISNCSSDLSVGTDEIKKGLERLRGDGKIVIE